MSIFAEGKVAVLSSLTVTIDRQFLLSHHDETKQNHRLNLSLEFKVWSLEVDLECNRGDNMKKKKNNDSMTLI